MAVKSAVYDYSLYTPDYYLKGFLAGGVCCSVTHGGATPIDFVKTRMQLVPDSARINFRGASPSTRRLLDGHVMVRSRLDRATWPARPHRCREITITRLTG